MPNMPKMSVQAIRARSPLNVWGLYILVTRITLVWPGAMVSHFHTRAYLPSDGHPYFATYGRNMQAGNLMSCVNLILPNHLGIENYFVFRTEKYLKKKKKISRIIVMTGQ